MVGFPLLYDINHVSLSETFRRPQLDITPRVGIPLLFKLGDMAAIGPLTMARVRHGLGLKIEESVAL